MVQLQAMSIKSEVFSPSVDYGISFSLDLLVPKSVNVNQHKVALLEEPA